MLSDKELKDIEEYLYNNNDIYYKEGVSEKEFVHILSNHTKNHGKIEVIYSSKSLSDILLYIYKVYIDKESINKEYMYDFICENDLYIYKIKGINKNILVKAL